MKINTKYNLYDEVFIMKDNKVVSCEITEILTVAVSGEHVKGLDRDWIKNSALTISYKLGSYGFYGEDVVYKSRKKLIKNLLSKVG